MIHYTDTHTPKKRPDAEENGRFAHKAVGLISGGLDSIVAARIIKDLGLDVHGVYFAMPWGCCDKQKALEAAANIGIKLVALQLDERYLEIVRKPKHGYGSAMNPCVDCRIHMFSRAGQYMRHIGAEFVFTGEVLGQRPMSQMRKSMKWIEKGAGLEGRLLRPLCAQHLDETLPEKEGIVDRKRLLSLTGRSRKPQYELADKYGIENFSPPAGGCLLTDKHFADRMKDTLDHGYRSFRETIALKWGRHFRISHNTKAVLGRDKAENEALIRYAHPDDIIMKLENDLGPTLILKCEKPDRDLLKLCGGLIQRFSKYREDGPQKMVYWRCRDRNKISALTAEKVDEKTMEAMYI